MTPPPRVMWRSGYVWLRLAAYDPQFLALLKRVVPPRRRKWVAAKRAWRIAGDHEAGVLALLNVVYGHYEPVADLDGDGDVQEPAAR